MTGKPRKTRRMTRPKCGDCQTYLDAPGVTDSGNGICTDCRSSYGRPLHLG